jgi:hypothetical protein
MLYRQNGWTLLLVATVALQGAELRACRAADQRNLPPLKIVNTRQLDLKVEAAGLAPSEWSDVEAWLSLNDGQTWSAATVKLTATLLHVRRRDKKTTAQVRVELPEKEGPVYSLLFRPRSRDGVMGTPPKPGSTPQFRIEVDTTPPCALLYAPHPDPDKPHRILLRWKATDRNLALSPITLEWAPRKEGPWTCIGCADLANTGEYGWRKPAEVPAEVYLRITVRDRAGNCAVAVSYEPVWIDFRKSDDRAPRGK